jgi:predicted dehydrogenase
MKRVRVVIIGLGRVGSGYDAGSVSLLPRSHVGAVLANADLELVAVCDADRAARERFTNDWKIDVPVFDTVASLFFSVKCDIVVVATATATHFDILDQCLAARPTLVFCEKPMCASASQAAEIAHRYEAAGVQLSVNYHRRWDARFQRLRDAINHSGAIHHAELLYVKGLRNYGAHAVDLLQFLFGQVLLVMPVSANHSPGPDPSYSASLRFEGNLLVNLIGIDGLTYEVFDLDVVTNSSRFSMKFGGQSIHFQTAETGRYFPDYVSLSSDQDLIPESDVHGLKWAYREFVEDIRENRTNVTSSAANAVAVQRVLDAIADAAVNGSSLVL